MTKIKDKSIEQAKNLPIEETKHIPTEVQKGNYIQLKAPDGNTHVILREDESQFLKIMNLSGQWFKKDGAEWTQI